MRTLSSFLDRLPYFLRVVCIEQVSWSSNIGLSLSLSHRSYIDCAKFAVSALHDAQMRRKNPARPRSKMRSIWATAAAQTSDKYSHTTLSSYRAYPPSPNLQLCRAYALALSSLFNLISMHTAHFTLLLNRNILAVTRRRLVYCGSTKMWYNVPSKVFKQVGRAVGSQLHYIRSIW